MKLNFTDFSRKFQFPLMLACATFPIPLAMCAFMGTWLVPTAWLVAAVYILLAMPGLVVPGKWRLWYGFAAMAAMIGLGVLAMGWTGSAFPVIAAALYGLLLMYGLKIATWSWDEEFSLHSLFLGFGIHVGVRVLLWLTEDAFLFQREALELGLVVSFLGYALLVMLALNRDSLYFAAKGQQRTSAAMRGKNTMMVLIFFLLAAAISLLPAAAAAIQAFWRWLLDILVNEIDAPADSYFDNLGGSENAPAAGPSVEETDPGLLQMILEKLLNILGYAILIALAAVGVYLLGKLVAKLLRLLMKWLNRYAAQVSEDYVEEITDIRESGSGEGVFLRRFRRGKQARGEKELPPQMRIRRRYLHLMEKHPEWAAGSTARENLPEEAAALYERARYSDHPVSGEEVSQFRTGTRKV